jgi:predicted RNA binding protein YcfA (HicA-like mRNA interferase family)
VSQTPAVTGKQLLKLLEGQGWSAKRIRGSHHILRHPNIPDAIPIPVHGNQPIKKGTPGNPKVTREADEGIRTLDLRHGKATL